MKNNWDEITASARSLMPPDDVIFGNTTSMGEVKEKLLRAADANVPVLIQGESGTGKEIIAKLIHTRSRWAANPFVKVHCPAIPGTLLESELFGYEQGAFTGANIAKPGRVEAAQGGTLFLDEISEIEPRLQAKLLHVLQDGQMCRIGGQEQMKIETRIICAANRWLEDEIAAERFRADLFYRISVFRINLPPLRERKGGYSGTRRLFPDGVQREVQPRYTAAHVPVFANHDDPQLAGKYPRTRELDHTLCHFRLGRHPDPRFDRQTLRRSPPPEKQSGPCH